MQHKEEVKATRFERNNIFPSITKEHHVTTGAEENVFLL